VINQLRECHRLQQLSERAQRVASESDCAEVLEDVYLYLDLEVSEERREQIRQHLDECSDCLREYGIEHEVKALVAQAAGDETAPRDLLERIPAKIANLDVDPADGRTYRGA
jgi:mycothiol system anti-sigma-R factor